MKKSTKISKVLIDGEGRVTALDEKGQDVKLSRQQRDAFKQYKSGNYPNNVIDLFGGVNILAPGFSTHKCGNQVWPK